VKLTALRLHPPSALAVLLGVPAVQEKDPVLVLQANIPKQNKKSPAF